MGQQNTTKLTRLVIRDSIDELMMNMKARKTGEIAAVMESAKEFKRPAPDEMRTILQGLKQYMARQMRQDPSQFEYLKDEEH